MAVVATGFFDGVHLGHKKVIDEVVSSARERGEEAIVVSFSQHPRAVFQRDARALRLLSSKDEKTARLRSLGIDRVELLEFDSAFASMTAWEYARNLLLERYGATKVVLGYDNRFGSDGLSTEQIARMLEERGVEAEIVGPCMIDGKTVSSTKIRALLEEGDVVAASRMLGYDYSLTGVVVPGKQLGRRLGFPTANLRVCEPLKQMPARGVYLTRTEVMGKCYFSMTNIADIAETNIFDFSRDIYSLEIKVSFLKRIRPMREFSSLEALSGQLREDETACRSLASGLL